MTTNAINTETARIPWTELQTFFAKGDVIWLPPSLDLTEIAHHFSMDGHQMIKKLMDDGMVAKMTDETAKKWLDSNAVVWAVVIAPWVLVQNK